MAKGPGIGGAQELPREPSETYLAIALRRESDHRGPSKSLQIAAFCPTVSSCGRRLPAGTSPKDGAEHPRDRYEGSGLAKGLCALATESFDSRGKGGAGVAEGQEDEHRRSRQAFSGRAARMVGWTPGASNRPASLPLGEAGLLPRLNQFSACRRWEQRQTGPRTPLHENEGRPRAMYDKKEHIKCSQVEYDSC